MNSNPGQETETLVAQARAGDRGAFAHIVEQFQRPVHAVAFCRVRDRSIADDITQEAFVAAWRTLGTLRDASKLGPWLCGIARNVARDWTKLHRREQARRQSVVQALPETPFERLGDAEVERLIADALAQIPDRYREPLVLFYYEDRSADDVARVLGIAPATVHQRLSRGRRYLADRMGEIVERGLTTHGPRVGLVAAVAAAIATLHASDASATTAGGASVVHGGVRVAEIVTALAAMTVLVLGVVPDEVAAAPARSAAPKQATPATTAATATPAPARAPAPPPTPGPTAQATPARRPSTPKRPQLAAGPTVTVPDCDAVARHLSGLLSDEIRTATGDDGFSKMSAELVRKGAATECRRDAWDDTRRLCVMTADDYDRAQIDCATIAAATPAELEKLPAQLRCEVVVAHWSDLILTRMKRDNAGNAEVLEMAEQFARSHRNVKTRQCNETPWTIELRTCIANATTEDVANACK